MNPPNHAFLPNQALFDRHVPERQDVTNYTGTSNDFIRDRCKVISLLALLALCSSLTPMPATLITDAGNQRSDSRRSQPTDQPRPSILSFAVNAVQNTIAVTTDRLVQTMPTPLWPAAPTGQAWITLPVQPGWDSATLFEDHSQSLVAKAVGSAEGTRRPDGAHNPAYYGHVDPGNAVWNVGTFSYQHCGTCAPDEADRRQLERLTQQFQQIQRQARDRYKMSLSLEEQLNAIDLANQAPLAALDLGGFIDRLHQAKQQGITGSDAILQARVYAYKNPASNRWEAPGLGNTKPRIIHDQARRQEAIARAIQQHR